MGDIKTKFSPISRYILANLALAVVYFVSAKIGLSLALSTQQVTTVWPPTGIALAALLLFGYKMCPGIMLGAFVANLLTNEPTSVASLIGLGNTLEAATGAFLLKQLKFDTALSRVRDILTLIIFSAILSTMVSATIGVASLSWGGLTQWANFRSIWTVWWVGDMLGALVVTPLLLVWFNKKHIQRIAQRPLELVVLFLLLIGASLFIFIRVTDVNIISLTYVVFPFMIWAALRFPIMGVVTASFIVSVVSVVGTIFGFGPFTASNILEENLISLQLFMFTVITTSLLLATASNERREAEQKISQSEQYFRTLIEHGADAIALIDPKTEILYMSASTKNILGYEPEELVGHVGLGLVHLDDLDQTTKKLEELTVNPGKTITLELRVKHKNGHWIWVESTYTNLLDDPLIHATVANFRDITRRKEAEDSLKTRAEELERTNKVMVGRELKMIELKKEIDRLKNRLS